MILENTCKSCKKKIQGKYLVLDRVSLAQELGETLTLTCLDCGADHTYHVDEFRAIKNQKLYLNLLMIVGGLSFLIGVIFYLFFVPITPLAWVITVIAVLSPFVLLMGYLRFDTGSQNNFNRHKLKGRNVQGKMTSTSRKINIATVEKSKGAVKAFTEVNSRKTES